MPGEPEPVVAQLGSSDQVVLMGKGWWMQFPEDSVEVEAQAVRGWTTGRNLAWFGETTDQTAYVIEELGEIPAAETMEDLGLDVAVTFGDLNTAPGSSIVMTVAPTSGDLEEVTFDVWWQVEDVTDVNASGWRLHIFATTNGGSYTLKSVEATALCMLRQHGSTRELGTGLTADGSCE